MSDASTRAPVRLASRLSRLGDHPFAGVGFVLAAMVVFSTQDTLSKLLVADYSPFEVAWFRYAINVLVLAPFVLRAGGLRLRSRRPGLHIGRGLAVMGSALAFMGALGRMPIADATAINFVSPLATVALSIPMLGERVGPRRWAAVVVGFAGAMIIVRPGGDAFRWAALLPILSAILWALGMVLTRRIEASEPALTTLAWSTLAAVATLSLFLPFVWRPLDGRAIAILAALGVISVLGQYLTILGYMRRPASVLAPLAYTQMVWSTISGLLVFGTAPGASTWLGAAIVVVSGLYVLHRERLSGRAGG